jgi:hypothetical protein
VALKRLHPGMAHHRPQHGGNDDRIVGVAHDRDEVGHEVDGGCQVSQQQCQPDPHAARQAAIGGQAWQQPQHIRQQPQRLTHQPAARPHDHQCRDQYRPGQQQPNGDPEQQIPPP